MLGSGDNNHFNNIDFSELVRCMRAARSTRCLFFFVVAGLVTGPAVSDVSTPDISVPAAGAELQIGRQAALEWDNWKLHKNHAVKRQGSGAKRFKYRKGRHRDLEGFVTACKEHCESGRADGKSGSCGGFVVNYSRGSNKKNPQHCIFKIAGASPYKKKTKDFYEWVAPIRIAENIGNDGHYRWAIPANVPHGTGLRISVVPTQDDITGIESDEFIIKL